jgi:hypothetical protein
MPETIWKKSQTKLFLDADGGVTPVWTRIGKSITFDLNMNAQTESFDFIQDDMPTEVLDYYKPELPIEHIAAAGDAGFDALWEMFEALKVGSDAVKKALIVFPKAGTAASTFRAWQMDATVVFTNLTTTEKKLKLSLYFGGTVLHGSVAFDGTTGAPTFTEDT